MSATGRQGALSAEEIARFGPDPQGALRANVMAVEARIARACARAGRNPASVRLLPVSKTVPAHIVSIAFDAGIRCFGENKIQEAMQKRDALQALPIDWSIIGHLQSNKAKHLASFAREFHALDSLRLASILDERLTRAQRFLDVYVQVNTSGEASKFGLAPEALPGFIDALGAFPRLRPRGLMTLALFSNDMNKVRPCFELLRRLRDNAMKQNPAVRELSMGMSGDFEAAIEAGSNVVRIGQAIFGKRPLPNEYYWPTHA